MKSKEEYRNNRGMTILPQPFGTMMFQRLVSKGYIDPLVHIPQLWGGAGVILSSNDSACDIFTVDEIFYHENPFVICDPDDQLCFINSPPFWSLPSETVFVRVFCNGIDGFDKMYAEVGPRRKGPMLDRSKLFDDVERMIIIETHDSCIVTFPSLRGLPKETALALQNRQDAKWMVGVNPFMSLFEERFGMRLEKLSVDSLKTMPKKLGFGWENYSIRQQKHFKAAGLGDNLLVKQTNHSDHRRRVQKHFLKEGDPTRLNQENPTWSTAQEFLALEFEDIHKAPSSLEPKSYLITTLPGATLWLAPRGKPLDPVEEMPLKTGSGKGFTGRTEHAGGKYGKAHRRPHLYAHVQDLRYLPISRPEYLWVLRAASERIPSEMGIGPCFDKQYMDILGIRALNVLEVYEFDE